MDYLLPQTKPNVQDRFDPTRFIAFRDQAYDPAQSYFLEQVPGLPKLGTYAIVDVPFRPDLISSDIYGGDCQYWYLLMTYNNFLFLSELGIGVQVKYFALRDLEKLFYSLTAAAAPKSAALPVRS